MSLKNLPQYIFSKESESELLEFLQAVQRQNMSFCDLSKVETVSKFLPLDDTIFKKLEAGSKKEENVIYINDSGEDCNENELHDVEMNLIEKECIEGNPAQSVSHNLMENTLMVSTTDDICALLIESLETEKQLSSNVMSDLQSLADHQIMEVYRKLSTCTTENIIDLGKYMLKMDFPEDHSIVLHYIAILLIYKIEQEYNSSFENLMNNYLDKYYNVINKSLLKKIRSDEKANIKVICQYLGNWSSRHKVLFLREYLWDIEKLPEHHILLIEALLNDQSGFDILKKLIEIMSNETDYFVKDKAYGKLLHSVIQLLGSNAKLLEQPLKYIIGRHKSIWKIKAKKLFDSNFSDSLLLTQSIRF